MRDRPEENARARETPIYTYIHIYRGSESEFESKSERARYCVRE